jgi:cell division ATP-binding protein FtsE
VIKLIQLFDVSKDYTEEIKALSDINVHIEKGDFAFLVGSSGAGKTTFLSLLYRGIIPTKGQVFVDGKNVNRLKWKEVPYFRRGLGIVFQDYGLLPERSAYDNVAFALQVTENTERDVRKKVNEALDKVGLVKRAKALPCELSGGEQQRISIARAIVNDPILLLGDEPTGNLDPHTSDEIMDIICDINYSGTTVIMATHNKSIVDKMRKRVLELEGGKLIRDEKRGVYENED